MKILFYVILELIFIIAAWFWGDLFFISMLKPGETCLTANYGINIGNYLALGWNNYFQWFSNIEQMKIAKYIILELLIIVLSLLWGTMMTNDHQSGEICITPAWGAQIQNYLELGWNNYFHWFRKDEQAPCRYETFTIIYFYILAVPLYTGLKIYGKNYLYQALSWQVIIPEWLLYIFVYLYFLFKQKNIILTLGSLGNAILGAILFFLPLIIYGSLIIVAFKKRESIR